VGDYPQPIRCRARKRIKFNELITILATHFDPKLSPIVQKFKFYNCVSAKGKTIAMYVVAQHVIAEHCEFGDTLPIMLIKRLA